MRALAEDGPPDLDAGEWTDWAARSVKRMAEGLPVQYVTGTAHFYGLTLRVDPNVLIPRPETEELAELALKWLKQHRPSGTVIDIGTGSGCLALTLKKHLPALTVEACDLSAPALEVARANADRLGLEIRWLEADALNPMFWSGLSGRFDLIISNPPYIADSEREDMDNSVLAHEPSMALFARGEDPLVFYRTYAKHMGTVLRPGGMIMVECSEFTAREVSRIWMSAGCTEVDVLTDIRGKDRFCVAKGPAHPPADRVSR